MPDPDQQFLAIASALTADRTFCRHVRWTRASAPVRRFAPFALFVLSLVAGLVIAEVALVHVMADLQALGGS